MKIAEARIENYQRLRLVEIKPEGELVVIGGKNGQGKTSLLDALAYALTGQKPKAERPVRDGEDRADIDIVTDSGLRIHQYITAAGNYALKISDENTGMIAGKPAEYLARLTSRLAFDPLEFVRQTPPQQGETLRKLMDLDFSGWDGRRKEVFDARTATNREIRDLEGLVERDRERYESLPDESVDAGELADKLNGAIGRNQAIAGTDRLIEERAVRIERIDADIERLRQEKVTLLEQHGAAVARRAGLGDPIDIDPLKAALTQVHQHNEGVRDKRAWSEKVRTLEVRREEAENLTSEIGSIDQAKRTAIANVEFPVLGLDFDEDGRVLYQDVPFSQAAASEQIKVSVAIGLEMAGQMKVLFIRDGSLLDDDSMDALENLAAHYDAQLFIERVGSEPGAIIIEDGIVRDNTREAMPWEDE